MAYSVKRSAVAKIAGISAVLLLAGCSHDQHYKREINGSTEYVNAPQLHDLSVPPGMILPLESGNYAVPSATVSGPIGTKLDIRPPMQALSLVNGSRAQFQGTTGILQIASNSSIWSQVVGSLQQNHFGIAERNDANQQLTTDWIQWNRADEDHQYRGRYQIAVASQGYQQTLMVKPLELQQNGKPVTDASEVQRYTAQLLNVITNDLDASQTARQNASANTQGSLDVQSGADNTGLPNLIVRAPFNTTWQRLPGALERVGMKVDDSNRNDGSLQVKYSPLDSEGWSRLGAADPKLDSGNYKVQVGDLDNRSSVQFIDPKGHVLTQAQNDALVAVLQASLNK